MPCGQPSRAASIWPVALMSSSIACLPRMISLGCSLSAIALSSLATASGCSSASVSTRMPRSAPMASAVRMVSAHCGDAQRDGDDLGGDALFLQAHGLLDGDLVERVHGHLDAGGLDAGAVRLHADLDVVVDHPLDGDEDFHGETVPFPGVGTRFERRATARLFAPATERADHMQRGRFAVKRRSYARVAARGNAAPVRWGGAGKTHRGGRRAGRREPAAGDPVCAPDLRCMPLATTLPRCQTPSGVLRISPGGTSCAGSSC